MNKLMTLLFALINLSLALQAKTFDLKPSVNLEKLDIAKADGNIYVMIYANNLTKHQKDNAQAIGIHRGVPHITLLVFPTNKSTFGRDLNKIVDAYCKLSHISVNAYELGEFNNNNKITKYLKVGSSGILSGVIQKIDAVIGYQRSRSFIPHITYTGTIPTVHYDANQKILKKYKDLYDGWIFDHMEITTKVDGKHVILFES